MNVLENGVNGVTIFGTTGEGASIGFEERSVALTAMIERGIPSEKMTIGLSASAVADVVAQVKQGIGFGVTRFLLLPPFYFKDLDDEGLFAWHTALFNAADPRAQFIVYHIPQVTQVPLSLNLILRLKSTFPDRVLAIKDSEGNWNNTLPILESGKIPVLVGDERLLHKAAELGGVGSITGVSNLYPQRLRTLFDTQTEDVALSSEIDLIVSIPVIQALKQIMALTTGDASWANTRPPLQPLSGQAQAAITAKYSEGLLA